MSSIVVSGDTSGAVTISAPAVAGTTTLTLPSTSGTVLTTASTTGISGSAISSGTVAEAYGGTGTNTGYYGFKNRIINGAMVIDQRNAGASVATPNGYTLDRWQVLQSVTGKISTQQNQGSVTTPAGFTNYLGVTSGSAYSVGSGDYYLILQNIEGFNVADLGYGTANAKTVTISFQVYSSLTGTFGGALTNGTATRSYPFTYTVSSANTWTTASVTIAGDTTGTWGKTNAVGMQLIFGLGVGSTYSGTAGTWAGANYYSATGATSVVGTNGATFYITGVQLEKGSTATSFDYRPYGTELALCQRYYESTYSIGTASGTNTTVGLAEVASVADGSSNILATVRFAVSKRTEPTMTAYNGSSSNTVIVYNSSNTTGISKTPTWEFISTSQASFYAASSASAWTPSNVKFHWIASAEL